MKYAVIWDVTLCGTYKNRVLEEHIASIIRAERISELGTTTLMMEAIYSSETSLPTIAIRWHIRKYSILHTLVPCLMLLYE
jgi:hypothetical protein